MINSFSGTPVVVYASLTNAAPGPVSMTLFRTMGANSVAINADERLYITNITMSSNDTTQALVTVDTGGLVPTKLASSYLSTTQPPAVVNNPPGTVRGILGTLPRAAASAVTAGKTVEIVITGYLSKT